MSTVLFVGKEFYKLFESSPKSGTNILNNVSEHSRAAAHGRLLSSSASDKEEAEQQTAALAAIDDDAEAEESKRAAIATGQALLRDDMVKFIKKNPACRVTLESYILDTEESVASEIRPLDGFLMDNPYYKLLWDSLCPAADNLSSSSSCTKITNLPSSWKEEAVDLQASFGLFLAEKEASLELSPLEAGLRLADAVERVQDGVGAKLAREQATLEYEMMGPNFHHTKKKTRRQSKKKVVKWEVRKQPSVRKGFGCSSGRFQHRGTNANKKCKTITYCA